MQVVCRRRQHAQAVIVVGSGEVFDLPDWINCPLVDRWVLVQTGSMSLQGDQQIAPEVKAEQLEQVYDLLRAPVDSKYGCNSQWTTGWSNASYSWALDAAGYPMIWIEPIKAFVHLFPVTKAQFERFLYAANPRSFGDAWYENLLALNPRVSYREINRQPYERLFLTGVLPDEAITFSQWMGKEYALLDTNEWRASYQWLEQHPSSAMPPSLYDLGISEDACFIWETIESQLHPRDLLELSLMSRGVIEWVIDKSVGTNDDYVGLGQTRDSFWSSLRTPFAVVPPIRPDERIRYFGYRLRRR